MKWRINIVFVLICDSTLVVAKSGLRIPLQVASKPIRLVGFRFPLLVVTFPSVNVVFLYGTGVKVRTATYV